MRSLALKPEKILSALKRAGIKTVPGGASLEVHLLAAKRGFSLHVAHDVTPLLGGGGVGTQPLYPLESDPESVKLLFERFVAELLEVRDTLSATGNLTLWFPWTTQPLDTPHSILPTPLRALRILALARLLLPAVPFISAPLTLFGPSLTTLALSFGANDLGSLAADAATATALKIARYSEGVQVLQEWERRAGG
jgi:2-iminoacetate synthase ThiH